MGDNNFVIDNNGHKAAPGCVAADPIAASGVALVDATIGADIELTVVAGGVYAVTASAQGFVFGIADVTTAANVIWVATVYETIIIQIPTTVTTLHYQGIANSAAGYMRRLS